MTIKVEFSFQSPSIGSERQVQAKGCMWRIADMCSALFQAIVSSAALDGASPPHIRFGPMGNAPH